MAEIPYPDRKSIVWLTTSDRVKEEYEEHDLSANNSYYEFEYWLADIAKEDEKYLGHLKERLYGRSVLWAGQVALRYPEISDMAYHQFRQYQADLVAEGWDPAKIGLITGESKKLEGQE